jgi:hypothetical protein
MNYGPAEQGRAGQGRAGSLIFERHTVYRTKKNRSYTLSSLALFRLLKFMNNVGSVINLKFG